MPSCAKLSYARPSLTVLTFPKHTDFEYSWKILLPHLARPRQGHDDRGVVIPNHPPEVLYGVRQGILGHDELAALPVTLQEERHALFVSLLWSFMEMNTFHFCLLFTVKCLQ